MNWGGKLVGAMLGFTLSGGRLLGAIIGGFLGHQFDRGFGQGSGPQRGSLGGAERQTVFFETTFRVMGHLAKADGRVSESEIRAAREIMHRMQLRPEAVRRAIELFAEGKQPSLDIDAEVLNMRQACGRQPALIRAFLEIQLEIAMSQDNITREERTVLWRIADTLGVGRVELTQLEALLRAQRRFGQGRSAGSSRADGLADAYQALGIEAAASDKDVKTAYRRLTNEHHPDKLVAKGLPDSMMEVAKERTREIRSAYEVIKEHRGIK